MKIIGARTQTARALLSVMQPLTGQRSTGNALVHATGANVVVPANSYAVPIMTSAAGGKTPLWDALVKTVAAVTVTAAGVAVGLMSMLGGVAMNFPAGTKLLWDPPIEGVEMQSEITPAPMAGGTSATSLGTVRRITTYEGLGQSDTANALFRASVGDYPAVVLAREGASGDELLTKGMQRREHRYRIYVVCSRLDADHPRRDEGAAILDYLEGLFVDRAAVDGEVFSAPPTQIGDAGRLTVAATSYVHWLELIVTQTATKIDSRTFPDWLLTREKFLTYESTGLEADELVIVDQSHDMDPET